MLTFQNVGSQHSSIETWELNLTWPLVANQQPGAADGSAAAVFKHGWVSMESSPESLASGLDGFGWWSASCFPPHWRHARGTLPLWLLLLPERKSPPVAAAVRPTCRRQEAADQPGLHRQKCEVRCGSPKECSR